jgi:hypothetical protein
MGFGIVHLTDFAVGIGPLRVEIPESHPGQAKATLKSASIRSPNSFECPYGLIGRWG